MSSDATPTGETSFFRIQSVHDVSNARRMGMHVAIEMGFARADATKIAVVVSELARNIYSYAREGSITIIARKESGGQDYIKIIANDRGPGITNLELAMSDGYTTSGGMGLGLSGSKRLMDEFDVHSEEGYGTTVTATKWLK